MTKYKIVKEWRDYPFNTWFWYVYEQYSFLGFKYWGSAWADICSDTKEDAESRLYSYIEEREAWEKLKSEGEEEYFIDYP